MAPVRHPPPQRIVSQELLDSRELDASCGEYKGVGDRRTDAEIIAESLRDAECFGVIFDRHAQSLTKYLLYRVGRDEGEALLGDVFRIAFESRARFDHERTNASPWLFGIASNLVLKHLRTQERKGRANRRLAAESPAEGASFEDVFVNQTHAAELLALVSVAIRELPERDREVVHLYVFGGLDYADIAGALEIPIGTVRSRLHRVRRAMRELAEESQTNERLEKMGEQRHD